MSRIPFMGIHVDNLTMNEAVTAVDELIREKKDAYVVTPNCDHMIQLEKDTELQQVYSDADLVVCDGKPLIWISKWLGNPIREKISGSDLFPRLCALAAEKGYTMFFLGAAEGVAATAAKILENKYPGLRVDGTYSPPKASEKNDAEMNKIRTMITSAKPDMLIVALGAPKQEKFIYHNRSIIHVPVSLGLGATLDFEAGNVKRAPKWMSAIGLEWFYRFTQEPKRLFKRYFIDDMKVFGLAWKYKHGKAGFNE